jgi:membrane-bound serine protease (ClpP class)
MIVLVIALLTVALILLVAEVLVIPGFGLAGALGVASLIGGVVLAFWRLGTFWGGGAVVASVLICAVTLWVLPRTSFGRDLVLDQRNTQAAPPPELAALSGQRGTTVTALRPAGAAQIGGQRVDVVSDGEFIAAGTPVRVVEVQGSRVVVQAE